MNISEMHTAFKLELDKTSSLELPAFEQEEIDTWLNIAIRRFVKNRFLGTDKGLSFEETLKRTEDLKTLVYETTITGANLTTTGVTKPNSYYAVVPTTINKWFVLGEEVTIQYHDIRTPGSHSTKRQGVTPCTVDTYRSHIDDPYSEHKLHYEEAKPLRLMYQNNIELVTDGNYELTSYYLRYLKRPTRVNILATAVTSGNIEAFMTYVVNGGTGVIYNGTTYTASQTFVGVQGVTTFSLVAPGASTVSMSVTHCDLPEHTHDEIVKLAVNMALENIEQPRYESHNNELNKVE